MKAVKMEPRIQLREAKMFLEASCGSELNLDLLCPAGVIAVAIFLTVAGLAIAGRFLYRRKETYRNQEVKRVKQEDGPDFPFSSQAESQNASEENTKEYFI